MKMIQYRKQKTPIMLTEALNTSDILLEMMPGAE